MKTSLFSRLWVAMVVSMLGLITFAGQEKVLQIFKNGEVIQQYPISEIDYVEVNDLIGVPSSIESSIDGNAITISWSLVEGATYNIYRSGDNINFVLLASGISGNVYTDESPLRDTNYYRVKAVIDGKEGDFSTIASVVMPNSDMPSGIYLGVMAFNDILYQYPIELLTNSSDGLYNSFIDNLRMGNGTILCYSVDQAITALTQTPLPTDLSTVSIVTFTDGLDQGSLMYNQNYFSDTDYLDDIHARLNSQKILGVNIDSYSVGLKDKSINTDAQIRKFQTTLKKIASSEDKAFEVKSMEEVNAIFKNIAKHLAVSNYMQNLNLKIPGISDGSVIRFTFDKPLDASSSKLYIEGTLNLRTRSLENIKYVGLSSTSGNLIAGVQEGIFLNFSFEGVHTDDNKLIEGKDTEEWIAFDNIYWEKNIEFESGQDAGVETTRSSAVVMLVIDCSNSLGDQFVIAKNNAKDFVKVLADNIVNPYEVSGISLDKSEVTMFIGSTSILRPTVLPSTALLRTVTWSSADEKIASVNDKGEITAHSAGNTVITATTVDGGFVAECNVRVIIPANEIVLNSSNVEIYSGETATLYATVYPTEADIKDVVWSSSNNDIAEVNADGVVVGKKGGEAIITATTTDGSNISTSCRFFVHQPVDGISFDKATETICLQDNKTVEPKFSPSDATELDVIWESSDEGIFTVDGQGQITGVSEGSATLTVTTIDGKYSATCKVDVEPAVNLGLSVPWATCNIGAAEEENYGNYYAWGEVVKKTSFLISDYKWIIYYNDNNFFITKYNNNSKYGVVDNKMILEDEDDVAYKVKGKKWRIPSLDQWNELRNNCSWTWTSKNGVKGYVVRSNIPGYTDRSIFIPAAGANDSTGVNNVGNAGVYLTNELYDSLNCYVESLLQTSRDWSRLGRCYGSSVRPVLVEY